MDSDQIKTVLAANLPDAEVTVQSPDNVHFSALVISQEFEGLSAVQRHQKVYQALGDAVGGDIHALSLKTLTPQEHLKKVT